MEFFTVLGLLITIFSLPKLLRGDWYADSSGKVKNNYENYDLPSPEAGISDSQFKEMDFDNEKNYPGPKYG